MEKRLAGNGKIKMNQPSLRFPPATLALLVYFVLLNIANGLYAGLGMQRSPVFQLASVIAFVWVLGWWVIEDNKRFRLTWVESYGVFLYIMGWMIIPVYLFKTRGSKAFLPLLFFVGVYVVSFIIGVVIAIIINIFRNL